jgi:thiamine pyrophosphokinase
MERWVGHGAESSIRLARNGSAERIRGADGRSIATMQAIVLADGDVGAREALDVAWPGWLEDGAIVVAADGGARHAAALGLLLTEWVGDGDSLGEAGIAELRQRGVPVRLVAEAKDESDTELAVHAALERGADRIVVLGALGGARLDHALANVGLLADPALRDVPASLLDARARITLVTAPDAAGNPVQRALPGPIGALLSLLPQGDGVVGVTTRGLEYPLADEPLPAGPARGLSNVRVSDDARVTVRAGRLLVIEGPARLSP